MIEDDIRNIHFEAFVNGWLPPEKVELRYNEFYSSAAWRYQPPHKIIVGKGIESRCTGNLRESLASYIYHELAHARWTDKDIAAIRKVLKAEDIPFSLFNLFEDARVEHLWRSTTGRKFNWNANEPPAPRPTKPSDYFFALIQNDGTPPIYEPETPPYSPFRLKYIKVVGKYGMKPFLYNDSKKGKQFSYYEDPNELKDYFGEDYEMRSKSADTRKPLPYGKDCFEGEITVVHRTTSETYTIKSDEPRIENLINIKRVREYYERTISAKTTREVISICKDWLTEFPQETQPLNLPSFKGDAVIEPLDFIIIESGSTVIRAREISPPKHGESSRDSDAMLGEPTDIDKGEVNRLLPIFERILKKSHQKISTETPQKRINTRNYMLGNPKIYRKKTESEQQSRKSVSIIVDCSGSMFGEPIENGKLLLTIINELAKKGNIRGSMILSKINGQCRHEYAVFKFPIAGDVISRIKADGDGEGFYSTIEKTKKLLQETDYTFVYTDGHIGDEHRSKSENHMKGIFTYGLYAGQHDMTKTLTQFFDCCISRKTAAKLIASLIEKIK